jgi:hypothetical protein
MTMKPIAHRLLSAAALPLCLALLGLAATAPTAADAFTREPVGRGPSHPPPPGPFPSSAFISDFDDDFDMTILQMQREAISSQEEQAREAGRVRRRDEVEQQKKEQSAESQAYFESVLEASQAALRAPRGAYYRKPGESSQEPPAGGQTVEVGGVAYAYDQGIFWMLPGPPYIVVVAPYGAVVGAIPPGAYRLPGSEPARFYYFGTFFEQKGDKFEVVKPPAGTLVTYLPDGYRQEQVDGTTQYSFGPTRFKPVFVQGVLVYQVVER